MQFAFWAYENTKYLWSRSTTWYNNPKLIHYGRFSTNLGIYGLVLAWQDLFNEIDSKSIYVVDILLLVFFFNQLTKYLLNLTNGMTVIGRYMEALPGMRYCMLSASSRSRSPLKQMADEENKMADTRERPTPHHATM